MTCQECASEETDHKCSPEVVAAYQRGFQIGSFAEVGGQRSVTNCLMFGRYGPHVRCLFNNKRWVDCGAFQDKGWGEMRQWKSGDHEVCVRLSNNEPMINLTRDGR